MRDRPGLGLVAVATADPLDLRTFSGLSAHLFGAVAEHGVRIHPLATRQMHSIDLLRGALGPGSLLARSGRRTRPRIRPSWYWSRRSFERFSGRFQHALDQVQVEGWPILQVGTHVVPLDRTRPMYCITDMTVVQAAENPQFTIAQAPSRIIREAISVQAEVFDRCETIFVLSQWAARSVVHDYHVPPEKVCVTGAGANLPVSLPRQYDADEPYVLFVGLDWETKGGPLLLDAFRLARARYPRLRLKVVGCSPPISEEAVDVIGFLDKSTSSGRAELLRLYAGTACLCLLSGVDAFPNVLLEAGYMGVPVVSTNEGSRPEVVVDGQTGLLVSERHPASVSAALEALVSDPGKVEAMGRAARGRISGLFTWDLVSARILATMGLLDQEWEPAASPTSISAE